MLRVLQEREVERLGGNRLIQLDVRVLATTNRNMRNEVKQGRFREDLFYRLNVFPIQVPPLRERSKDILAIAERLIEKHHLSNNTTPVPLLSDSAKHALTSHRWPGNVRELDNVIQRALILRHGDQISAADLQFEGADYDSATFMDNADETHFEQTSGSDTVTDSSSASRSNLGEEVQNHEHQKILQTLRDEMGNRKAVAEKLGISQRTLRYKLARMREKGISVPDRYGAFES